MGINARVLLFAVVLAGSRFGSPCLAQETAPTVGPPVPAVTWQQSGPIEGAFVTCLALTPKGHILAGTTCGLFESADDGDHWVPLGGRVKDECIGCLAINPRGHIFAIGDRALLRSTDNGRNWMALKMPHLGSLSLDPDGRVFACNRQYGVYFSADNGYSWQQSNTGLPDKNVFCVTPGPKKRMYAATGEGVFSSQNGGKSWKRTGSLGYTRTLKFDPTGRLLASCSNKVYASTDGENWRQLSSDLLPTAAELLTVTRGGRVLAAPLCSIYKLVPEGNKWTDTEATDAQVMALLSMPDGQVFAGTSGCGILRSTDDGERWTKCNGGLSSSCVYALAPASNGQVFAGGPGVWRSSDNGKTWTDLGGAPSRSFILSIAVANGGRLYAGTQGGHIFTSPDSGATWSEVKLPMSVGCVYRLIIAPNGELFAGTHRGILRSPDNGATWTEPVSGPSAQIKSIIVSRNGRVFAGTEDGALHYSTDQGNAWAQVPASALPVPAPQRVLGLAEGTDSTIYAAAQFGGILASSDNGTTWKQLAGLDAHYLFSVMVDESGRLFVGDAAGVVCSVDGGQHGTRLDAGMHLGDTACLAEDSAGYLYAGTLGHGVCRSIAPLSK